MVNKHLLHDLTEMGVWSPAIKNQIIYEDGSVQKIAEIPDDLKDIYKYELHLVIYLGVSPILVWLLAWICAKTICCNQNCLGDQAKDFG